MTYIPPAFEETRLDVLHAFMREHSFATLVTTGSDGLPEATHVPLLLDTEPGELGTLTGHLARANRQWERLAAGEALVLFQGPHAYISPGWYESTPAVPTWNYVVVHARGTARLIEDPPAVRALLSRMVRVYESAFTEPWSDEGLPEDWVTRLQGAIVAFEIEITQLQGKFKLSQNRPAADQRRVAQVLAQSPDPAVRHLAQLQLARHREE